MNRSIFLLILALGGVWLILDDQKGNRTLSRLIASLVPDASKKDWGTVAGLPPEMNPRNKGMFDPNAPTVNRTGGVAYD